MSSLNKSPVRSQGTSARPRQQQIRRTHSTDSPAHSNASGSLSTLIQEYRASYVNSLSPLVRKSLLTDNTDIEEPIHKSWWQKLDENSRDVIEILENNKVVDPNNIMEELDLEMMSQEKKDYTLDLPESSDGESINSIVIPQRQLFTEKEHQPQKKFGQLISNRDTLTKTNSTIKDKTINVAPKSLFPNKPRTKPIFPAGLLNISDKTSSDKTLTNDKTLTPEKKPVRSIFGNHPGTKRKNMFTNFILSNSDNSDDEIPEIQPRVFGFPKPDVNRCVSSSSRGLRDPSPTSSITTDMELYDWKHLPSSTMVENQIEAMMTDGQTPKRARLSKLSEAKESDVGTKSDITLNKSKLSNKSVSSKDKAKTMTKENSQEINNSVDSQNTSRASQRDNTDKVDVPNVNSENELNDSLNVQHQSKHSIDKSCDHSNENIEHSQNKDIECGDELKESKQNVSQDIQNESQQELQNNEEKINNEDEESDNEIKRPNESQKSQDQSKEAQDENPEVQDESQEVQNESQEVQEESQKVQDESQKLQDENQELPDESQEVQDEGQEVQEEIEDESEEIQDKSVEIQDKSVEIRNENEEARNESDEVQYESLEVQNESQEEVQNGSLEVEDKSEEVQNESQEVQNESIEVEDESDEVQNESQEEVDKESLELEDESVEVQNESQEEVQNETDEQESDEDIENEIEEKNDSEQENQEMEHDEVDNEAIESDQDNQEVESSQQADTETPNVSHDRTGRNREKNPSPELVLHDPTNHMNSFTVHGRNTSVRKSKSMIKNLLSKPSLVPARESLDFSNGTKNSSVEGSGWDSHRTTRKTLRQTFGKDFTPRKSLRTMVMEKSAKRQTLPNKTEVASVTAKFPLANSTEIPQDSAHFVDIEDHQESDHELSERTRQTTLEMCLQKSRQQNMELKMKIQEAVRNSLKARPKDVQNTFKVTKPWRTNTKSTQPKAKQMKTCRNLEGLPEQFIKDLNYKPPKRFKPPNASWVTKRLYKYLETKLEPKYCYKARVRSEKLIETIYQFSKDLRRQRVASADAVDVLKHEMARLNIVKTHFDFYEFFNVFMPREIIIKVVPDVVNMIPMPRHGVFADILRGDNTVQ